MKMHTAQRRRKAWKAEGNPPCDHPQIEEECYDDGRPTGDYVCTTCGAYVKPDQGQPTASTTEAPQASETTKQSFVRKVLMKLGL